MSLKLQQQGYKYQQLMKSFHKFYRSHSDELKKFGTTLMELRSSIWKEVLVEYILLNFIWTCFWCVRDCFYFLSLFYVLFIARAFSYFLFARACIIALYIKLTLNSKITETITVQQTVTQPKLNRLVYYKILKNSTSVPNNSRAKWAGDLGFCQQTPVYIDWKIAQLKLD